LGLAIGRGDDPLASEKVQAGRDVRIVYGLSHLSRLMATRRWVQQDPYFLWSVERVGTLYNTPLIGEVDWYRWGADIFLSKQQENGCWDFRPDESYPRGRGMEPACTAFGLLFLKRVHVAKDLTAKLPWKEGELNQRVLAELSGKPVAPPPATPGANKP
jgi:hypothetical protein